MPGNAGRGSGLPLARLHVRLLGSVEVVLDGQRLRAFNALRLQRFLASIVLRRGPQQRARLAFELWPDSNERQARTNLRKLLHEFRQALPEAERFVEIDHESIRWVASGPSRVDVVGFRDALAGGDLVLAARLYGGDLLPGCYDGWLLDERAMLRAEACGVFGELIANAVERGDHRTVTLHARRLIEVDPIDEAAVRAEIEAQLALGDRAAAIRSYHRYAEALERELEVVPGPAMQTMYARLRTGSEATVRAGEDSPSVAESPFVGRAAEMSRLQEAWEAARRSGARVLLVTGEPGIGKSRLAVEFGRQARAKGHLVASARAYEAAGRPPWGPIVDLLRSAELKNRMDGLHPVWRAELSRLLPELGDLEAPDEPRGSGAGTDRHRLLDAVGRALVGGDGPRILIIDDLQWCDAETIDSIGFLVRSQPRAPVLVIGTVRPEEVPEEHALIRLTGALEHDGTIDTVPLDRLDQPTTAALATLLSAEETIDPDLAARLWRETEGNPLFVIETVRAGIASGGSIGVLTPTMRTVLRARLGQLSDGAARLAEVAAVVGRPFSIGLLESATGVPEQEVVDRIDELWHRRIVRDQGSTYDFSHDKLRAVALEMISPATRRQLHKAVAEAIAADAGRSLDGVAAQLAAHYDQAGLIESAIAAYRVAGAQAVAVSALGDAVTLYSRALSILGDRPPSADRDDIELDIRISLGSPLVARKGYGCKEAHRLYERARSLCVRLGRPVAPPVLRGLGLARLQGCRIAECAELGQALVDHESRDPAARTEGRYLLGVSAFWGGDLAAARRHLEAAVASYDASRREEHLALYAQDPKAVCLVRLGLVDLWTGDPARAGKQARAALALAGALDHPMTRGYTLTYAAILAAEAGDLPRLAELLGEAERLWERLSDRYLVIVLEALRGWLDVREGSLEGVEAIVDSVARSRADGETLHLSYALLLLARARGVTGELHHGRAAAREGIAWSDRSNQRYLEAELWRIDGELAYRSGETEAAAASLGSAVDVASDQRARWLELRALHSLAARFPDPPLITRLAALIEALPSGHDLPAYRAAEDFLGPSA